MIEFLTKLLEKHKLQECLEWQVDGQKELVINKLRSLTSEDYYSRIFAILDLTVPKEKIFIGTIANDGFVIRKRINPFSLFPIKARVNAEFTTVTGQTKLVAKINGMRIVLLAIRLLILLFLGVSLLLTIFEALIPPVEEINPFSSIPFLFLIAAIFVVIPYSLAIRDVGIMKTELNGILGNAKTITCSPHLDL